MTEKLENSTKGGKSRRVIAFSGNESAAGFVDNAPAYRVDLVAPGEHVGIPVPSGFVVSEAEEPHFRITQVASKTWLSVPISLFAEACKVSGWEFCCKKSENAVAEIASGVSCSKSEPNNLENLYTLSHKTRKLDDFYAVPGGTSLCRNCFHRKSSPSNGIACDVASEVEIEYYADGLVYCVEKSLPEEVETKSKPEILI